MRHQTKTRQNKKLEPGFDSIKTGYALKKQTAPRDAGPFISGEEK
jgi:hypothetical protein